MSHRRSIPRPAALLGYGGLVPFLAGAIAAWWPAAIDTALVTSVFSAYAAAILAFLGGLQWGIALPSSDERLAERLTVGVVPALIAWIALLLPSLAGLTLLVAAFLGLIAWERMRPAPELPPWYAALRLQLTTVVVACHVAVATA